MTDFKYPISVYYSKMDQSTGLMFKTQQICHLTRLPWYKIQTWEKLIFVCKPIFGVEKFPQIYKHIKVPKIVIFPLYQIFCNKNRLIGNNNADLWALMGKNCKKNCFLTKHVHNFLKNSPQALLACLRLFPCLFKDYLFIFFFWHMIVFWASFIFWLT